MAVGRARELSNLNGQNVFNQVGQETRIEFSFGLILFYIVICLYAWMSIVLMTILALSVVSFTAYQ